MVEVFIPPAFPYAQTEYQDTKKDLVKIASAFSELDNLTLEKDWSDPRTRTRIASALYPGSEGFLQGRPEAVFRNDFNLLMGSTMNWIDEYVSNSKNWERMIGDLTNEQAIYLAPKDLPFIKSEDEGFNRLADLAMMYKSVEQVFAYGKGDFRDIKDYLRRRTQAMNPIYLYGFDLNSYTDVMSTTNRFLESDRMTYESAVTGIGTDGVLEYIRKNHDLAQEDKFNGIGHNSGLAKAIFNQELRAQQEAENSN